MNRADVAVNLTAVSSRPTTTISSRAIAATSPRRAAGLIAVSFIILNLKGSILSIAVGLNGIVLGYGRYRKSLEVLAASVHQSESGRVAGQGGFVLYLRSFRDDLFQFDLRSSGPMRLLFLPPFGYILEDAFRSLRLEELIVRSLWPYGPVLAVAAFDSDLDYVGALQLSFSHGTWQKGVESLSAKAQSTLMLLGASPGFIWEMNRVFGDEALLHRMMLLIPPEQDEEILRRWKVSFAQQIHVPDEVVSRAVAVRISRDGSIVLLTCRKRTAAAYRMALDTFQSMIREEQRMPGQLSSELAMLHPS